LISGILVTDNSKLADRLYFIQKSGGAVSSPFDCWLLLRSTKTLSLRVQQQSNNAMELAKRLQSNSSIKRIIYPGLENHPQHELAKNQQRNPEGEPIFGSMISITLGSIDKRDHFLSRIKLFTLAESLGGVESLVCAPYHMTHVSVPKNIKEKIGLTADLLRLSVGVEHVEDLYLDICNALND
jgi:cystathionine beta-lyase/cystathionine gamma-synthase